MRPICLALATTAVGIAGLLSTAGAEETTSSSASSVSSAPPTLSAGAQPSVKNPDTKITDMNPQLHYVTSDPESAQATPTVVAARVSPNAVPDNGAVVGNTQPLSTDRQMKGQQVGALQYQQDPNWSAQLQYSYMGGGSDSKAVNSCCDANDNWRIDRQILVMQFGVSYHFK